MAVSKAQLKANRKYDAKHPQQTAYMRARRNTKAFIKPGAGTKLEKSIEWRGVDDYKADLMKLKALIDDRLNEL